MKAGRVLLVDDEIGIRETLSIILEAEGFGVESVGDALSALRLVDEGGNFEFIVSDIRMPGMDGLALLREIRSRGLEPVVIMISAYGTIESSIEAVKNGADDYIGKPVHSDELILRMRMAEERRKLKRENAYLRKRAATGDSFSEIIFASDKIKSVIEIAKKAAQHKTTVLITGESGTGKELFARAIHSEGERRGKPFVAINCAAIPESLLESELFGYVKGAFTGANSPKRGLFEEADGGCLFLDELGEFPPSLQPKLLRALQDEQIRRLGDTKTVKVDVRIIAATSQNLAEAVELGTFRGDLFYRLNVLGIHIPPLRDRREDIPPLVEYFITSIGERLNRRIKGISKEAMGEILQYPWRGNVRELQNVIERAIILSDGEFIAKVDLSARGDDLRGDYWYDSLTLGEAWDKLEKACIEKALVKTGGSRTQAAKLLGISLRSLLYKMKEYRYSEGED
ncbi:MAG: sigma-54-dependent transcriptional regulator [Deltaproteobacteria bacterium]